MTTIVCIKCQKEMQPHKTGARAEQIASFGSYKIWECDIFRCPHCNIMIAAGFGRNPIAEHFQANYQKTLMEMPPMVRF